MNKRASSLFAAFVGVILLVANCETPEHDNATPPTGEATSSAERSGPERSARSATAPGESGPPEPIGATNKVVDIIGNPKKLIGKSVTVIAYVEEVYGARAFALSEEPPSVQQPGAESPKRAPGSLDDGLLTLIPKVGSFPTADAMWIGGKARVTGVVQELVVKDIEREIGWELPPDLKSKFKGKPALVARSIERFNK
jgi:hypothetical protein